MSNIGTGEGLPTRGGLEDNMNTQTDLVKKCDESSRHHMMCPNMKCTYAGFDGERYRCRVCGDSYFLDCEEMR